VENLKSGRKTSNIKTEPSTEAAETRQKKLGLFLIAMVMKIIIIWVVRPYDSVEVH
jgi:hypothetical protein